MAFDSTVVEVGTSPTELPIPDSDSQYNRGKSLAILVPLGGSTIKIGGPGVTWTDGWPVMAGEKHTLTLDPNEKVYAIAQNTPQSVHIARQGA